MSFNFFENLSKKIFGSKVAKITPIPTKPFSLECCDEENNIIQSEYDNNYNYNYNQYVEYNFNTKKIFNIDKIKID